MSVAGARRQSPAGARYRVSNRPFLLLCKSISDAHPSVPQDTLTAVSIDTGATLWTWNPPASGLTYGNWRFWTDDTRQTFAAIRSSTATVTIYQIDDTGATVGSGVITSANFPSSLFRDQNGDIFFAARYGSPAALSIIRLTPSLTVDQIYAQAGNDSGNLATGLEFVSRQGNWLHETISSIGGAVFGQLQRRWQKDPISLIIGFSCFFGDASYFNLASAAMTTGIYTGKVLYAGNGCITQWEQTGDDATDVAVSGSQSSGICVAGANSVKVRDASTGNLIHEFLAPIAGGTGRARSVCLNEANGYMFTTADAFGVGGVYTVSCISLADYSTVWSIAGGSVLPYLLCSVAGSGHNSDNI